MRSLRPIKLVHDHKLTRPEIGKFGLDLNELIGEFGDCWSVPVHATNVRRGYDRNREISQCIVTLPLGVLRAEAMVFEPPLPRVLNPRSTESAAPAHIEVSLCQKGFGDRIGSGL